MLQLRSPATVRLRQQSLPSPGARLWGRRCMLGPQAASEVRHGASLRRRDRNRPEILVVVSHPGARARAHQSHGFPLDMQEKATDTELEQAKLLSEAWAVA